MEQWFLWLPGLLRAVLGDIGNLFVSLIEWLLGAIIAVVSWIFRAIFKVIVFLFDLSLAVAILAFVSALGSIKWSLIGTVAVWFFYGLLLRNPVDFNWFSMVAGVLFGIQFVAYMIILGYASLQRYESNRYFRRGW